MKRARTAVVVGLGLGLWLVASLAPAASADDGTSPLVNASDLTLVGGGPSWWEVVNDTSACETINEGMTPVDDGAFGTDQAQTDAFDDGLMVTVSGKDLNDKNDVFVTKGDDVITDGVHVKGVHVWRVDRALPDTPTMRSLIAFHNGGNKSAHLKMWWDSNLGSDGGEAVRASSTGDTTYQVGRDRWVVSSDDATTPSDPALTFVLFGKGSAVRPDSIVNGETFGTGCFTVQTKLAVPAGQTRYLLFFTQMHDTNEHATNTAAKFNKEPAKMFADLSDAVRSEILNWDLS